MGVYYYFYNTRLEVTNERPIDGECSWVAKLDYEDVEFYIKKIFELNPNWSSTDKIVTYADYHGYPSYTYENGVITYNEPEEDYY